MKKLVILQNEIMEYRKPVYDGLAKDYDVNVLHSGPPSVCETSKYREIIVPSWKLGPFFIQNTMTVHSVVAEADAVIAMFDLHWPGYFLPTARGKGRYILWGHRYGSNRGANFVRDLLIKRADAVLLYGEEDVDSMLMRGIGAQRIFIAWNTIHIPNHYDYSQHQKNSLLFVGRLQRRKQIDDLILSFSRCLGQIPDDVVLDIVGCGSLRFELEGLVEKLGLFKRIRFHGEVTDHEVLSKLFSTAFAYVSPGHVGLGVLHSFAYGIPVITCKCKVHAQEFENIKNEENALVYDSHAELDKAIVRICSESGLSSELGSAAYRQYEARSLERMLRGFRDAIESTGC